MKDLYISVMDKLYALCMWISGISLLILTIIIPVNVFMRYVMNSALSWPEPLAVVIMIIFTFFAAAVCYRSNMHIAVMLMINMTSGGVRLFFGIITELCMLGFSFFVVFWGTGLIETTWDQYIAEFPILRVGLTYVPLPLGSAITILFVIERIWTGQFFPHAAEEAPTSSD